MLLFRGVITEKVALATWRKKGHRFSLFLFLLRKTLNRNSIFSKLIGAFCRPFLGLQNLYSKFSSSMLRFSKKNYLFFVSDVTILLATWQRTTVQLKKYSYNRMKSSKLISKYINASSDSVDYDDIKIYFLKLHETYTEPFFEREIFGIRSGWKFYDKCGLCCIVYPESFGFFSHMVREIIANYCLINQLINYN
jgi:hypothetical protein